MSLSRLCILVFALLFSASTVRSASPAPRYRLTVSDRPLQKRFVVTLTSLDERPFCIDIRRWPNAVGELHFGSVWATLQAGKRTYPARDENFGRCVGPGCTIHIAPHTTLTGFVAYSMFGHPAFVARLLDRRLVLSVDPAVCSD